MKIVSKEYVEARRARGGDFAPMTLVQLLRAHGDGSPGDLAMGPTTVCARLVKAGIAKWPGAGKPKGKAKGKSKGKPKRLASDPAPVDRTAAE